MGFLNLQGLERLWTHIVTLVGKEINNLNLKNGTGNKSIQQEGNTATGDHATALGLATIASGNYSVSTGIMTKAEENYGVVVGKYNDTAPGAAVIVGNGNASIARSNAATIDWDGNAWFANGVSIGENKLSLATEEYVEDKTLGVVKSVNGNEPNENGEVTLEIPAVDINLTIRGAAADAKAVGDALATKQPSGNYALKSDIPTRPSDIGAQPAGNYITTETDPTVPAWAKAATKPSYTASEVGADTAGSAASALASAKSYTDTAIANLPDVDVEPITNEEVDAIFAAAGLILPAAEGVAF